MHHHHNNENKRDGKVNQFGGDRRHRENKPGEINFAHHACVGDETGCGIRYGCRKISPGHQRRVVENGIRHTIARYLRDFPKNDCKNNHAEERANNRPGKAHHRLLVHDGHVSFHQKVKQILIMAHFSPI